jgi:hypothetical protein
MRANFINVLTFGCLLLFCGALRAAEIASGLRILNYSQGEVIISYRDGSVGKDIRQMPPAEREDVMRQLRAGTRAGKGGGLALLALKDEEGIAILAQAYNSGVWPAVVAEADFKMAAGNGDASILPYLIHNIYNGATQDRGGGDSYRPSVRDAALMIAADSIAKSPLFPPATRDWASLHARDVKKIPWVRFEESLAQFKAWWEHNREAVLAKDYANATWLPTGDPVHDAPQSVPPPEAAPIRAPGSPAPAAPPPLKWPLLAAAALAALALAMRLLRRR